MSITPDDAAIALKQADAITARSATLNGYQRASPFLILWGLIWIVANIACDASPVRAGTIWLVADIIGFAITAALIRRVQRPRYWRQFAGIGAIALFVIASAILLQVKSPELMTAYISLVVGTAYLMGGLWRGTRLVAMGAAVGAVSVALGVIQPPHFFLWMGIVGGGSLVLGGIWFRQV